MEDTLKGTTNFYHLYNSNEQIFNFLKRLTINGNNFFTDLFLEEYKRFLNEIKSLLDLVIVNVYDDKEDYKVNIKDEIKIHIKKLIF